MRRRILLAAALALSIAACAPIRPTTFVHPSYNFGFIERVAVVPLENLSDDRGAGARMSRYVVAELLATEAFDVVEPGEVTNELLNFGAVRTAELPREQLVALGRALGAQGIFLGTVTESQAVRSGNASENVVTLDLRLVETETGSVVWSTTLTETGRGFWASLFGARGRTMGEVSRRAARHAIDRLVD